MLKNELQATGGSRALFVAALSFMAQKRSYSLDQMKDETRSLIANAAVTARILDWPPATRSGTAHRRRRSR
ncbi:bsr1622 [Bradyrhizobium diazoefficiens USDA 110]|uniref:Bsr1622 protein n=1 Tax=Bradyrhizobium diazoefficiens (strain JCM 10833 / BCRC 13528 / IAM 13628 / NBRC 14792 / USDA 110) TaxID=224911 RepID=Q89U00_BRADU|nr:hypothetical protein CO678_39760 [Bradyrhizobium diazoefficiens]QBP20534.1 hypothetical protein Bdiaspc4_08175 [Bradyrhizobium diazoefficiens]BAC46887.1 bsr1622 [Bradyrhizobium diazoefficiens USDA 110]